MKSSTISSRIKKINNFLFFETNTIPAIMLATNKRGEITVSNKETSKVKDPNKITNWVVKKNTFRYL